MEEVVNSSDVIVIANNDQEYSRVAELITSRQEVIDLTGHRRLFTRLETTVEEQTPSIPLQQNVA
jgi:hypothetical protein